jgi:hypothetical protein
MQISRSPFFKEDIAENQTYRILSIGLQIKPAK